MNIFSGIEGLCQLQAGSILSIGNFDGIHRGHQALLSLGRALRRDRPGSRLAVATFEPHPLTVLRPEMAPPRLTTPQIKRRSLAEQGVDDLVELAPEPSVLNMTAEEFWATLRDRVRPSHLVEGGEFNFGKNRGGNIRRLREWSAGTCVELHVIDEVQAPLLDLSVVSVSSTVVRWLIAYGRVRDAAICIGRPYRVAGEVIRGYQRGRELGYPTANMRCDGQLVPADGVYGGRCSVDGATYPAAVSVGTLPTFGSHERQIESYLIGFTGDLYGRTIEIDLLDWLREQRKFASLDQLKEQIARDVVETMVRQNMDAARAIGAIG
ncbi:MAG TPA: riboflavin biosynthesis protein RibF [Tepidisphaeraceae bacterium]|nr:riboflavin biosynthesis protein RibF [Tepidisphaeraceae bacterium]